MLESLRDLAQAMPLAQATADSAQASPPRSLAQATQRINAFVRLQLASCEPGQRISRMAVRSAPDGTVQLQCFFSDGSRSSAVRLDVTRAEFQAWRAARAGANGGLNLSTRPQDRTSPAAQASLPRSVSYSPDYTLPRGKLADASMLAETACPVCLECFATGDELVILPCLHVGHAACLQPWLATAHTCPTCRFELPKTSSVAAAASVATRMWRARAEMRRLTQELVVPPPPPAAATELARSLPPARLEEVLQACPNFHSIGEEKQQLVLGAMERSSTRFSRSSGGGGGGIAPQSALPVLAGAPVPPRPGSLAVAMATPVGAVGSGDAPSLPEPPLPSRQTSSVSTEGSIAERSAEPKAADLPNLRRILLSSGLGLEDPPPPPPQPATTTSARLLPQPARARRSSLLGRMLRRQST